MSQTNSQQPTPLADDINKLRDTYNALSREANTLSKEAKEAQQKLWEVSLAENMISPSGHTFIVLVSRSQKTPGSSFSKLCSHLDELYKASPLMERSSVQVGVYSATTRNISGQIAAVSLRSLYAAASEWPFWDQGKKELCFNDPYPRLLPAIEKIEAALQHVDKKDKVHLLVWDTSHDVDSPLSLADALRQFLAKNKNVTIDLFNDPHSSGLNILEREFPQQFNRRHSFGGFFSAIGDRLRPSKAANKGTKPTAP